MLLIGTVFAASLLGSLHCAGMCGGVLALCLGVGDDPDQPAPSRARLQVAYNAGRLVMYVALGVAAGTLGAALDSGGQLAGVQRAAMIVAGSVMILFGIVALLRVCGVRWNIRCGQGRLHRVLKRGYDFAFGLNPTPRALTIGLLTGLLPCGWLWAFVIAASATGSPWMGGIVMAVFWSGTLPVMVGLGVSLQALTGRLRRHLPTVTACSLILVGIVTLFGRFEAQSLAAASPDITSAIPAGSVDAARHYVESLEGETPPCCSDDDS